MLKPNLIAGGACDKTITISALRLQNMGKKEAIVFSAVEMQWRFRPVALASDVDESMGANLITEFYATVADPSHDIGGSIDPSPRVAVM